MRTRPSWGLWEHYSCIVFEVLLKHFLNLYATVFSIMMIIFKPVPEVLKSFRVASDAKRHSHSPFLNVPWKCVLVPVCSCFFARCQPLSSTTFSVLGLGLSPEWNRSPKMPFGFKFVPKAKILVLFRVFLGISEVFQNLNETLMRCKCKNRTSPCLPQCPIGGPRTALLRVVIKFLVLNFMLCSWIGLLLAHHLSSI